MSSNNASVISIIFHFYVFGRNLPSHVCTPPCTRAVQHPEPLAARKIQRINSGKHAELHPTPFQPPCACQCSSWMETLPPAESTVCSGTARRRPGGRSCLFFSGVSSSQRCLPRCSTVAAVGARGYEQPPPTPTPPVQTSHTPYPNFSEPPPTASPARALLSPLSESSCRALFRERRLLLSAVCLEGIVI